MNGDNQQLPPDQNQAGGQWQFKPEDKTAPQAVQQQAVPAATPPEAVPQQELPKAAEPSIPEPMPAGADISWTASEYIAHSKGIGWFVLLGVAVVAVAALVFLLTRDLISTAIIVIIAALVGTTSARKPRVLPYHLSPQGLTVGNKFYPYAQFKSFSIMDEGAFSSIMFLPMQRFMPPLSIYYDPEDEERIVAALSMYVPMEMRKHDAMDILARRLRF